MAELRFEILTHTKPIVMVKIGIIRCDGTLKQCPGTGCFKTIREKSGQFQEYSDQEIELIGMATCGGCPGRDAVRVAQDMVRRGAEVIYLATCVVKPVLKINVPVPLTLI
jgi:predicted metal-binding protein